jgi:hypothetical protein
MAGRDAKEVREWFLGGEGVEWEVNTERSVSRASLRMQRRGHIALARAARTTTPESSVPDGTNI